MKPNTGWPSSTGPLGLRPLEKSCFLTLSKRTGQRWAGQGALFLFSFFLSLTHTLSLSHNMAPRWLLGRGRKNILLTCCKSESARRFLLLFSDGEFCLYVWGHLFVWWGCPFRGHYGQNHIPRKYHVVYAPISASPLPSMLKRETSELTLVSGMCFVCFLFYRDTLDSRLKECSFC